MSKSKSPDSSPSEAQSPPELSLTPPRVQRPKPPEIVQKPQKPQPAPVSLKPERPSTLPKPRRATDGPRPPRVEKPEPVPAYGERQAGDEIVLPYSGKTVQITHFYESAGNWYAAFEMGCVRVDVLEKLG